MIAIIAAYAKNRVIGNKGRLPWSIPSDLKRFRRITEGNIVIMGRKTYEEIGKPLSERINIILSQNECFTDDDYENTQLITARSFDEALLLCSFDESLSGKKVFICGGASVYKETLPYADELYLTVLDNEYEGDVYFPDFDKNMYECVYKEREESGIPYTFYRLIKQD